MNLSVLISTPPFLIFGPTSVAFSFLDCGCGDCHHQRDPRDGVDRAVDRVDRLDRLDRDGDIGQRSPANLFAPWISPQLSHHSHPPWRISQIWQIPPRNSATPWPQLFCVERNLGSNGNMAMTPYSELWQWTSLITNRHKLP